MGIPTHDFSESGTTRNTTGATPSRPNVLNAVVVQGCVSLMGADCRTIFCLHLEIAEGSRMSTQFC